MQFDPIYMFTVVMPQLIMELTGKTVDEIFDLGLHQFLLEFIRRNQAVADAIAEQYRFTR